LALCATLLVAGVALAEVNVNTATQEELTELTGIGQVKAAAIIKHREEHGDFASVDDLIQVDGIGEATLSGLRDQATVGTSE